MLHKLVGIALVAVIGSTLAAGGARSQEAEPELRAGFGRADVTWHVSGAQGQYSAEGNSLTTGKFDPYVHNVKTVPSDGLHSRSYARAIVVEGTDGTRVAYVGHDLYIQQDVLTRRVAQLVAQAGVGIDGTNLMIGASHNHSATSLSSTAWGVWAFTDVLDTRFFDFVSKGIAQAVIDAAADLRPVRIGAAVNHLTEVQQNILGPRIADDGTPAGFPRDFFDRELAVVRFDDVTNPQQPRPLGMLVNLGMHPESLATTGMPSADFVGQVERMVTHDTDVAVVWSQGSVGDVEPDRDARAHPPSERKEYWHRDFSQMERMSRIVADRVVKTWGDVETGKTDVPSKHIPFSDDLPVAMLDARFPGPASHPYPSVSNCRTQAAAGGAPGVPVVGLPDCERIPGPPLGFVYDAARQHGLPVPENYSAFSYEGAQESLNAHLQVIRLGEILLASCPCEPVSDMTINFKSRADLVEDNTYDGFDWDCEPAGADHRCNYKQADYRPDDWRTVSADLYARMQAQIHNDAAGWDDEDPESIAYAEAEPEDPTQIRGNFTRIELQDLGTDGFRLPLMVGMTNDYIGYIVTYREYQSGDHYRKALTAFGPHTADYINSRLLQMAAALRGGDGPGAELFDAKMAADGAANEAKALALGEAADAARDAYEAALPPDGTPGIVSQPDASMERFDGAQFRWIGGSHYADNPIVRVERLGASGDWQTFATQDGGEVVVNVAYADGRDPSSYTAWASGAQETLWTGTFEAFDHTPTGDYRFVVSGTANGHGDYSLVSGAFAVERWDHLQAVDGSFDPGTGEVRFRVSPIDYPDTYAAVGVPYLNGARPTIQGNQYCLRCSFRPWSDTGDVASAQVTVERSGGGADTYPAVYDAMTETWTAVVADVSSGDVVEIRPGDVVDAFGNTTPAVVTL